MEVEPMRTSKHNLSEREKELVSLLMQDCQSTGDIQTKLKRLFAGSIEQMLEAEIEEHLGYEKHNVAGNNSGNSRNGYNRKTIISDYGESEIAVPRDRNGEFAPRVLEKGQTRTDEIEHKILAMYSKGMSQRDIENNLREIYGADISQALISKITDRILPEVNEWQNRPLESVYPVIYFDGIVFKSRKDNQIINKCIYSVLGVDMEGRKEILGIFPTDDSIRKAVYLSVREITKKWTMPVVGWGMAYSQFVIFFPDRMPA
jgi:putative transposase